MAKVVVVGVTESRDQKSDKRDAYGLAEKLRTGVLDKRIFKAPQAFTLLRELSRGHLTATRDLVIAQASRDEDQILLKRRQWSVTGSRGGGERQSNESPSI